MENRFNPLLETKWYLQIDSKPIIKKIENKGFRFNPIHRAYQFSFPVNKYLGSTTLECTFSIPEDFIPNDVDNKKSRHFISVSIDVHKPDQQTYPAFYDYNSTHRDFIDTINRRILKKMKSLRIVEEKKEKKKKNRF